MKSLLLFLIFISITASASASTDSIPVHLKGLKIPDFKLLLVDSVTNFYTENLDPEKNTLIMMFSPDCDHCQHQTEDIIKNIEAFSNTQIVMNTVLPFSQMKQFYETYQLQRFKNIIMGRDVLFFFSPYFRARFTPYLALYNKKGELLYTNDGQVKIETLIAQLPKN
jgi:thioredoxin-related protein